MWPGRCSTACDEFTDDSGHTRPPIVLLEQGNGVEISTMGTSERFVDVFDERVAGRFGNVKV